MYKGNKWKLFTITRLPKRNIFSPIEKYKDGGTCQHSIRAKHKFVFEDRGILQIILSYSIDHMKLEELGSSC
jgi:hypothetical protein